ncbi:MAG: glycosyltransferase family 9 protein [Dermatophilaceae bacterium]
MADSVDTGRPAAGRVLVARLDGAGDVLLAGPAVRRVAAAADRVDLLVSRSAAQAARMLPGVAEVHVADTPWTGATPPPADAAALLSLVSLLRAGRYDELVVLTSYHQSPLPLAVLARLAGIPRVVGTSDAYPGTLLDVRHRRMPDGLDDTGAEGGHEVEAMLALTEAAGYPAVPDDDGRLRVEGVQPAEFEGRVVVIHPGASVPTRAVPPDLARDAARLLTRAGWHVVVTGGPGEADLGRYVTPRGGTDLTGRTDLAALAGVLATAEAIVVGNTGPAHLAAAVGTPVVGVFAPVVPAQRWAPWRVSHVLLGDQDAPCRMTRARTCPVPGHPCVSGIHAADVVSAVRRFAAVGVR